MQDTRLPIVSHVYLKGDPGPLATTLLVEQVAALLYGAKEDGAPWVRVPGLDGREALIRPEQIAAIIAVPTEDG